MHNRIISNFEFLKYDLNTIYDLKGSYFIQSGVHLKQSSHSTKCLTEKAIANTCYTQEYSISTP